MNAHYRNPTGPNFQTIFEACPHPYLILDPDPNFTIAAVDNSYLKVTGTERNAIIGRGLFEVFPDNPMDFSATGVGDLRMSLDRVLRDKVQDVMGVQRYDIPTGEADGSFKVKYWSPVNTPVFGPDGSITQIIHHVEDITEYVLNRNAAQQLGSTQAIAERMEAEVLRRASELKEANRRIKTMMEEAEQHTLDQRQAEIALRQSEEQFRSAFENAAIGMAIVSTEGRWIRVNQALCEMLGYGEDELSRLTFQDVTFPEDLETDMSFMKAFLQDSLKTCQFEKRYIHKHGHKVHVDLAVSVLRDDHGIPLHFICQIQDVTESKQAQESLAVREREFRLLAESMPQIVWITSADGLNTYFNHQWVDYTGLSLEDSYGHGWNKPFHPQDRDRAWKAWKNAVAHNGTYSLECRLRRADGQYRWWLIRGIPVMNDDGNIEKWFGTCTDIHDLKQAEESLQLSALVYQSSSEAMVVTDAIGTILTVNPAFTEFTGYRMEEVIGQPVKILQSGHHDKSFYRAMWDSLNVQGRWQGEIWDRRKNGEIYPARISINTVAGDESSGIRRVALFSDISEMKRSQDTIWRQANYDALTGLPNRRMFVERLEYEIKKAHRAKLRLALIFIDLDLFKEVNDTLGHLMGDHLLEEVATRLQSCVREADTVGRLGGDEFTVILGELENLDGINRIAGSILEKLAAPYQLNEHVAYVSASMGITVYPDDATECQSLLKNADQAMYESKRLGRNRFNYFKPSMQDASQKKMELTGDLRKALAENQFKVFYQPIINLRTGKVYKAEALLRWKHPDYGLVSPADFIPIAEETGLIIPIGEWVFHEVARQLAAWRQSHHPTIQISVNKSPIQFRENRSTHLTWIEHLGKLGLPGDSIVVEITEGMLMDIDEWTNTKLLGFRDAGMQVALDDFGTGYSSLSYLKKLDIDYLKIDQSFVRGLQRDSSDLALCEAIIVMAHKLGIKVIAEGIETVEQRDLLTAANCDYAQGYLFSRPVPADEFEKFIENTAAYETTIPS